MKKLNLKDWAAVAEIAGTIGVIVSLLFLVYTVNRNTLELQAVNENEMLQLNDQIIAGLLSNTDILAIADKRDSGEALSRVESWGLNVFTLRQFNAWEMAFYRYQDGLFDRERWNSVNEGYADGLIHGFSRCDLECWSWQKENYPPDSTFVRHVDAEYARRSH